MDEVEGAIGRGGTGTARHEPLPPNMQGQDGAAVVRFGADAEIFREGTHRYTANFTGKHRVFLQGGGGAGGKYRGGDAGANCDLAVTLKEGDVIEFTVGRGGKMPGEFGGNTSMVVPEGCKVEPWNG